MRAVCERAIRKRGVFELVIGICEARAPTSIDKLYAECFDVSISVFPVRVLHIVMLFIGLSRRVSKTMSAPPKTKLRSAAWFGTADKNGFMYRSWMKNQGIPDHKFAGKPIIGICNT